MSAFIRKLLGWSDPKALRNLDRVLARCTA